MLMYLACGSQSNVIYNALNWTFAIGQRIKLQEESTKGAVKLTQFQQNVITKTKSIFYYK